MLGWFPIRLATPSHVLSLNGSLDQVGPGPPGTLHLRFQSADMVVQETKDDPDSTFGLGAAFVFLHGHDCIPPWKFRQNKRDVTLISE